MVGLFDVDETVARETIDAFRASWRTAPNVVGYYVHDAIEHTLAHTRNLIFKRTTAALRRGKKRGWLKYRMWPASRSVFFSGDGPPLDEIGGNLRDRSKVVVAQEYGGTFSAESGRYLTVPVRAGLRKVSGARRVRGEWHLPPSIASDTFVLRNSRGLYIAANTPERKRPLLLFALRKSVTLRPLLGARRTFDADRAWRNQRVGKLESTIIQHLNKHGGKLQFGSPSAKAESAIESQLSKVLSGLGVGQ